MTEIESYSDRLKPPTSSGPSRLDPQILHLDESLFPPVLWKEYFEGQAGTGTKKEKSRKRRKLEEGDNEEEELVRLLFCLKLYYQEQTNDSHLKNLLMPISILMMMKDQRIIRITMLIISIMVKEMMIRVERKVSSFVNRMWVKLIW